MTDPTQIPWADRGFSSQEEYDAYAARLKAAAASRKGALTPSVGAVWAAKRSKADLDHYFSVIGDTPKPAAKPTQSVAPVAKPSAPILPNTPGTGQRPPVVLGEKAGRLVRGQESVDLTRSPAQVAEDLAPVTRAAQILSRARLPTGETAPGWWESLATPNPESWDITNALRPQVVRTAAENTAEAARLRAAQGIPEVDPLLNVLAAAATTTGIKPKDLEPPTLESPLGVGLRLLTGLTSGAVGLGDDLAHAFGLGDPNAGGVVERIKKGEGLMGGGRDIAAFAADKMLRPLAPEPADQPSPEWREWDARATATGVRNLDIEPKMGRPGDLWKAWSAASQEQEEKRSLATATGAGIGLFGDLMVPIDIGIASHVLAPMNEARVTLKAISRAEDAALAAGTASKLPASARIYRALGDALTAVKSGAPGVERAAEAAGRLPFVDDARLLAVERMATHPEAVAAVDAWIGAAKDVKQGSTLTLPVEHAKKVEQMGLPLATAQARSTLKEAALAMGGTAQDIPHAENIARMAYGQQLVDAIQPTAGKMSRIGNVNVPSEYLPAIRKAVEESPVGQLAEEVRTSRTIRRTGVAGPTVMLNSEEVTGIVDYFKEAGVESKIPAWLRATALRAAPLADIQTARIPVAEWNATLSLAAEVEASRVLKAAGKAGAAHGLALHAVDSPAARRADLLAKPAELRPGPLERGAARILSGIRDRVVEHAPRKYVSPIVQEWVDKAASRLSSVDEGIKHRIRVLRRDGLSQAEAYNAEFVDAWTLPPIAGSFTPPYKVGLDTPRLAADAVAASFGSVLGQSVGIHQIVNAEDMYRLVAALAESPNNMASKIADRLAQVPAESVHDYVTRTIALPSATGKTFGELVSMADVQSISPTALAKWGLDPAQAASTYRKAEALAGRFSPSNSMEVATTLHVGRRAGQAAQQAVSDLQAILPSSVPSPQFVYVMSRQLLDVFNETLDVIPHFTTKATFLQAQAALAQDFATAVENRLMQEVLYPAPLTAESLANYPLATGAMNTRKLLGESMTAESKGSADLVDWAMEEVDIAVEAQAAAFVAAMHRDLGQLATKQVAVAMTEELSKSIADALAKRPPMPLSGIESARTLIGIAEPELDARLASMRNITSTKDLAELPVVTTREASPMLGDLVTQDVVAGLDAMADVRWASTPWDTAALRLIKAGVGEVVPTAKGLIRAGMLGGYVLPNLPYHMVNILSAPALLWQTVGGKLAAGAMKSIFFDWEATQALKYYYGRLAGQAEQASKELFRVPSGQPYTAKDVSEILASNSISKSQSSFELSNDIARDVMRWTGQTMASKGPEEIGHFRDWARRNLDPRTTNLWGQLADACDTTFRTGVLIAALKAGKTEEEAVLLARAALFDYGSLTAFERKHIAHNVLFYSFLRHNVTTTTRALLSNPSRAAHLLRLTQGLPEAIQESDDSPRAVWARNVNTNDYATSKPFLKLLTDKDAKRRFALNGPAIPFADAAKQMVDWVSMFNPVTDPTLKAGQALGQVSTNLGTEALGHMGPFAQYIIGTATYKDVSFGEVKDIGTYIDPKMLYWIEMGGLHDTLTSWVNLQDIPPDRVNTRTMTAFNGHYYMIAKDDFPSTAGWNTFMFLASLASVKRSAMQIPPWVEQAKAALGVDQSMGVDPATGRSLREVSPGAGLKLPLDPKLSTGLLEALRNIGAVAVTPERTPALGQGQPLTEADMKKFQEAQNLEAYFGAHDYPSPPAGR